LVLACVPPGDGKRPLSEDVYFPVGLAVDAGSEHLIIVNSDFDLQFNQGTLQSVSLDRLRAIVPTPCSMDEDCDTEQVCDREPSEENRSRPSFLCVDAEDRIPCAGLGEKSDSLLAVSPGRCAPVQLDESPEDGRPLLIDVAETSAFATQGLLLSRPCRGDAGEARPCTLEDSEADRIGKDDGSAHPHRLMVPVRGDTSIRYLEFTEDGHFECGRPVEAPGRSYLEAEKEDAPADLLRCNTSKYGVSLGTTFGLSDDGELITTEEPPDPKEDEDEKKSKEDDPAEEFRLQPEPFDLTSTDNDQLIVLSHQVKGRATTLFNDWQERPHIIHVLDEGLSESPIGVAALPGAAGDAPSFLLSYRSEPRMDLLQFIDDGLVDAFEHKLIGEPVDVEVGKVFRPLLAPVASTTITTNSSGLHSRGVLVDDSQRRAAVDACGGDEVCIEVAEQTALDVYVANRSPNSLLLGRTGGTDTEAQVTRLPSFHDNIPLTAGPSRIVKGFVTGEDGQKVLRIFVICFDSAMIYVFDPVGRRVESLIRTGRGPYSLAFDTKSSLAFVGHFTDSYIGVISLDMTLPRTFGATLLTVGTPTPPRASK
jgi:hypothetical protein